jgi:SHS2 domain-containing protein
MDELTDAGYREIEHTADWELEVWAPDLTGLLTQAALGMYALSKTRLVEMPRLWRNFAVPYPDPESLLVDFLSELLFLGETEGLGFDSFHIELDREWCRCRAEGAPLGSQGKEIKAVTFHRLAVVQDGPVLRVNIVFDV